MARSFLMGLEVGDIITAYHKGYHRVTNIEPRYVVNSFDPRQKIGDEYASLIHYQQLMTNDFSPRTGKHCCDESYCRKIDDQFFEEEIEKLEELRKKLLKFKKDLKEEKKDGPKKG